MGTLIARIIPILMQVLAGVGVGELYDKVAANKLPSAIAPGEPVSPGFTNSKKLILFVVSMVIGAFVWRFVAKKLKLKM